MISKQGQNAAEGATAIQAARDVNYNEGISPAQMVEIIDSVQQLVQVYTAQSKDIMEQRLQSFRDGLIKEFSGQGNGKAAAFSDPDFQGALLDAQKAVARSGDKSLEGVLVDLVSQKSQCEKKDRLSLTLNDAIAKAGSMTNEDFDLLALIFVFKNMQMGLIPDLNSLAERLKIVFEPLAANPAEGELAISYLESHGCLRTTVGGIGTFKSGFEILVQRYPGALTKGVARGQLEQVFPAGTPLWDPRSDIVHQSSFGDELLLLVPGDAEMIDKVFENSGLSDRPGSAYADLARSHPISAEEFFRSAAENFEGAQRVVEKYDSSGARDAILTAVGLALAHARLSKFEFFSAPLSIWVR
jgi:hypothetical protein